MYNVNTYTYEKQAQNVYWYFIFTVKKPAGSKISTEPVQRWAHCLSNFRVGVKSVLFENWNTYANPLGALLVKIRSKQVFLEIRSS